MFFNNSKVETQQNTALKTESEQKTVLQDFSASEQVGTQTVELKSESKTTTTDRFFTQKNDEKKNFVKKRIKILSVVYGCVLALVLGFSITNLVTLAILDKDIAKSEESIESYQRQINGFTLEQYNDTDVSEIEITINEPRKYYYENVDLTIFDKLTIFIKKLLT